MATDLYRRMLTFDYGDEERQALMEKVWRGTPWMVNAFIGSISSERAESIRDWCRENFGDEAWPIHGKPGNWQFGSATIFGWEWIGFSEEAMLTSFMDRWRDHEWIAAEEVNP